MKKLNELQIGCIGCGMMGGALMEGIARKFVPGNIFVTDADSAKAEAFASRVGVHALASNKDVVLKADVLFLAVKPMYVKSVLSEIRGALKENTLLISMAAGVTLDTLKSALGDEGVKIHIVRIMPNLPATVGEAMIGISPAENVLSEEADCAKSLLEATGKAEIVSEKLMDGVTAVSGSGPAYAFLFIEALADAAVRFGIPRKQAYIYAAQTLRGAATMALEDGRSISELKDAVCSPAGTTIEGVIALEKNGFRNAVIEAATAAFEKSVELGKK